ncbi:hypothetical protein D9M69_551550 [compost metagenome]
MGAVQLAALVVDNLAVGLHQLQAHGGVVVAVLVLGDGAGAAVLVGVGVVAFAGLVLAGDAAGRGALQHFGDVLDAALDLGRTAVVGEGLDAGQGQDGGGEGFVLEHGEASWGWFPASRSDRECAFSAGSPAR